MLRDLTIQNYRCFKDFHIDGLARVNLIVGMNNSGKTSLLEAVYLLVNQVNPGCLLYPLDNRGEILPLKRPRLRSSGEVISHSYQIDHIFYGHKLNTEQAIHFQSQQEQPLSLKIQLSQKDPKKKSSNSLIVESDIYVLQLSFLYGSAISFDVPLLDDCSITEQAFRSMRLSRIQQSESNNICDFITTNLRGFDELATLWDEITLTPKEDKVLEALQILEQNIQRISFTSRQTYDSGILLKIREHSHPIPLGSMGEGMRRILTLVMAAVTVENGFLLVDEIETGLYYETQTDMWRLILETAQQLNVQVFATTHSWDCISAFQEALGQLEDTSVAKLFRLSRKGENIRAVDYPAEKLGVAVRQNIEVR